MSYFKGLKLTKLGETLLANINGNLNETLTFTSGEIGAGTINGDDEIRFLTSLKEKWKDLDIISIEKDPSDETIVKLELQFSNIDLKEAKIFREIGIYAKGNNGEPILFAYSNAGENYDYIPLPQDNPQNFTIEINLKITSNSKIDAIINMAGFVTIGKMLEFLKNKLTQIPTIAELQLRKNLKVGDIVEVLGYYSAGDGAGHKRIIASEDDGSGVQLSNNLWACIVHNGEVNVSWFGAKGDGVTDDTEAIQKTLNYKDEITIIFTRCRITKTLNLTKRALTLTSKNTGKWDYDSKNSIINEAPVLFSGNMYSYIIKNLSFINRNTNGCFFKKPSEIQSSIIENNFFLNFYIVFDHVYFGIVSVFEKNHVLGIKYKFATNREDTSITFGVDSRISNNYINGDPDVKGTIAFDLHFLSTCIIDNNYIDFFTKAFNLTGTQASNIYCNTIDYCVTGIHFQGGNGYVTINNNIFFHISKDNITSRFNIYKNDSTVITNCIIAEGSFSSSNITSNVCPNKCDCFLNFNSGYNYEQVYVSNNRFSSSENDRPNILTLFKCERTTKQENYVEKEVKIEELNYITVDKLPYHIPGFTSDKKTWAFEGCKVYLNTGEKGLYESTKYGWVLIKAETPNVSQLNTLYHAEKMKQENVYDDYISYMDEKTIYDKQQRKLEQNRQLAYEQALEENPELTYEEFMSLQPMTLNLVEEPQPSENLKKFMEKYL